MVALTGWVMVVVEQVVVEKVEAVRAVVRVAAAWAVRVARAASR